MDSKFMTYMVKRFLMAVLTVFLVVAITFFVMHAIPASPFSSEKAKSDATIAALEAKYGLDKPLSEQYFTYLKDIVTKFDFGPSLKLRGRNVIDIIAVVLIVAVLGYAGMKLMNRGGGEAVATPMTKVTYVVKAEEVPVELYENCLEHLPSPLMASGALVGGQIETVEKEPFLVLNDNGEWVEDPAHVTLLFTATTQTPAGAVMTTKVGDQEVRIGKTDYILKSEYIEFQGGTIVDVRWGE